MSEVVENGQAPPEHRGDLPAVAGGEGQEHTGELLRVRVADDDDPLVRGALEGLGARFVGG